MELAKRLREQGEGLKSYLYRIYGLWECCPSCGADPKDLIEAADRLENLGAVEGAARAFVDALKSRGLDHGLLDALQEALDGVENL